MLNQKTRVLAPQSGDESTQEVDLLGPIFLADYELFQLFFGNAIYVDVKL